MLFKLYFFGGDGLARGVGVPVGVMGAIFSEISSLRKLIFDINVYFALGIGVLSE